MEGKRKWTRHVHVRTGALRGWCAKCPASKRRTALRTVARNEGYAVAVRRLNFVRNAANRRNNRGLHVVAARDIRWMERALGTKKAKR
jgi:hypothetical protein